VIAITTKEVTIADPTDCRLSVNTP
jgi:hypothetical protein